MLFLDIKNLPWAGKETSAFPSFLVNTIAETAVETYAYTGGAISISVRDRESADRVVAAINMAVRSNIYGVISTEGEILTIDRVPAPVPVDRPTQVVVGMHQPMETPDVVDVDAADALGYALQRAAQQNAPTTPAVRYPAVVARTNEVNPAIQGINNVLNRNAIRDEDLEKHLFALKGSSYANQMRELNIALDEYRTYLTRMAAVRRKINDLSALATNDNAVKSVIDQIRRIAEGMPDNKITDVFATDRYIVFTTAEIHAHDPRKNRYHNIGRIMIVVPIGTMIGTDTVPLHFQPLDFVLKGSENNTNYLVPHVNGQGSYCYGNATEPLIEAVAKRDLICLLDIAIRFLENPNTSDGMGTVINQWPVVGEQ